jgi:hypothetical protein
MPIGTLKKGRISHKRGRMFQYNPPKPTLLMPVGKIEFVPCYCVAPIMGTKTAIYRKVARGVTKRLMVFDNSRIINRMRYAYGQGA